MLVIVRLRNSLCSSGVVFLYREGSARYAFSFAGAQEACARIGARIATPEQLYAAYLGGYEQCDAGWLSDQTVRWVKVCPRDSWSYQGCLLPPPSIEVPQGSLPLGRKLVQESTSRTDIPTCHKTPALRLFFSLRYPIQNPREACYGDMDGYPGVRNYGVVGPEDLYDVYCYAEDLNGDCK